MATRYAIIGTGMMGQEHIRNIALLDGAEISSIAEPDEGMRTEVKRLLPEGAAVHSDYRSMLSASDYDAIVIASPNHTHHDILLDAIATGKPILCEKPLCTTGAACKAIEKAASGTGTPIWVAMEYRYMPAISRLLELQEIGGHGPARMVSIREHRFPFLDKVGDWNRFNVNTGGTFVEKCCHFFDLMAKIADCEPVRLFASGGQATNHLQERYDGATPDILDHGYVAVDFESGLRAMLDLCMFAEGSYFQEEIAVVGDHGKIEAFVPGPGRFAPDGEERIAEVVVSPRATKQPNRERIPVDPRLLDAGDHNGATYYQHERFLDVVRGKAKPEVTIADGARAVMMGEAAEESCRTHLPIML